MRQLRYLQSWPQSWPQPDKQWVWRLLGFATGGAAVVVATQQVLDPESGAHHVLLDLKERMSDAGARMRSKVARLKQPHVESHALPGPRQPASVQGYAARFLADWCSQPERSQLAVALGGGPLLDWLLETATDSSQEGVGKSAADTAEQEQAERALAYLLQSDATAALVAERPGAVPRLLRHCQEYLQSHAAAAAARGGQGSADSTAVPMELLVQALQQRAAAGLNSQPTSAPAGTQAESGSDREASGSDGSIAGMMHWILGSGGDTAGGGGGGSEASGWSQGEAFLSDLEAVMDMLLQGTSAPETTGDSSHNGVPPASPGAGAMLHQLAKPGEAIPDPTPLDTQQGGQGVEGEGRLWLQRQCAAWLAAWAEAHPSNRDKLTGLNVAAAISHVAAHVSESSGSEEARALQLQLIRLVIALAQGPASLTTHLREGRDLTSTSLFQPLSPDPHCPASQQPPNILDTPAPATAQYHLAGCLQPLLYITADAAVERDTGRALAALAAIRTVLLQGGLPVAAAAAEEPLMPLLEKIAQGAGQTDVRGAAVRVLAAMAHSPRSLGDTPVVAQQVASWRDWLLATLCQDKGDAAQEALRTDCAEALAELAALPGVTGLQVTHYWLAALLASLATKVWPFNAVVYTGPKDQVILPKAPQPPNPTNSAASNNKASAPAPLPMGAAIDARDFLDAVPVLPSHIASVAAALAEASAAVVEEYEPPPDFDPGSQAPGPLARAFHRQVVRTVDVMVAEKRVCQALEVLNSLVAADPTKQQWLLTVGVMPLLYRLCNPSDPDSPLPGQGPGLTSEANTVTGPAEETVVPNPYAGALARWVGGKAASAGKSIASYVTSWLPSSLKQPLPSSTDLGSPSGGSGGPGGLGAASGAAGGAQDGGGAGNPEGSAGEGAEPRETDGSELDVYNDHAGPSHLCLRRQVARLLALLAVQPAARAQVGGGLWRAWLEAAAQDADCRLASHATRALLNLEAFRPRPLEDIPALLSGQRQGVATHRHVAPAPVYLDQVHLLNPSAAHLWTLAHSGSRPHSQQLLRVEALPITHESPMPVDPEGAEVEGDTATTTAAEFTASPIPSTTATFTEMPFTTPAPQPGSAVSHAVQPAVVASTGPSAQTTSGTISTVSTATTRASHHVQNSHTHNDDHPDPFSDIPPSLDSTAGSTWAVPLPIASISGMAGSVTAVFSTATSHVIQRVVDPGWLMQSVGGPVAAGPSPTAMPDVSSVSLPVSASVVWPPSLHATSVGTPLQADSVEKPLQAADLVGVPVEKNRGVVGGVRRAEAVLLEPPEGQPVQLDSQLGQSEGHSEAGCTDTPTRHPLLQYALLGAGQAAAPVAYAEGKQFPQQKPQQQQQHADGDAPLIDVVFVHGIRGGPFITWRKPGTNIKGSSASRRSAAFLCMSDCWPSDWLPRDAPRARLLTVEYLAPVSGWEGESLPLEATVERVMGQLQAAGVGQRPLVFVAHSMGGLLVKEMLVRSMRAADTLQAAGQAAGAGPHVAASPQVQVAAERAQLAAATQGIVFFATPHFGSGMAAMGWKLRHMPYAAPAPALAQLTPGPHLVELNEALRAITESQGVRIVSAVEGLPTQLAPVIPKVFIVPEASAWPGFGRMLTLANDDHISLCKPADQQSAAYRAVLDVIQDVLQTAESTGPRDQE